MLQSALRMGASWIGGPGLPGLLLAERSLEHGLPQVLVLGRTEADLEAPLEAISIQQGEGLRLNLLAVLAGDEGPLITLPAHRRRLGSLLCAIDAGLSCFLGGPMLPSRLPGLLEAQSPRPLEPAAVGPLDRSQLLARRPDLGPEGIQAVYSSPPWEASGGGYRVRLWPGVAAPPGGRVLSQPLTLPTATPVAEALRGALRAHAGGPVPFLPADEDPSGLHALRLLTPEAYAFKGTRPAWEEAFRRLAVLPAPPHFCARC